MHSSPRMGLIFKLCDELIATMNFCFQSSYSFLFSMMDVSLFSQDPVGATDCTRFEVIKVTL